MNLECISPKFASITSRYGLQLIRGSECSVTEVCLHEIASLPYRWVLLPIWDQVYYLAYANTYAKVVTERQTSVRLLNPALQAASLMASVCRIIVFQSSLQSLFKRTSVSVSGWMLIYSKKKFNYFSIEHRWLPISF